MRAPTLEYSFSTSTVGSAALAPEPSRRRTTVEILFATISRRTPSLCAARSAAERRAIRGTAGIREETAATPGRRAAGRIARAADPTGRDGASTALGPSCRD